MVTRLGEIMGKEVFSENGIHVGVTEDVTIDSDTGRVLGIALGKVDESFAKFMGLEAGKKLVIPYGAVKSIGDIVLIRKIETSMGAPR